MALGSVLVYGSASTLLWWQLEPTTSGRVTFKRYSQPIAWIILALGVTILIVNNTRTIFTYLG